MTRGYASDPTLDDQVPPTQVPIEQPSGLRPDIHAQLVAIRPGDSAGLAQLLALHPNQRAQILAAAAQLLGNSTVQGALALGQGAPPSAANRADAMADFREVNGGPTQGAPPSAANRADAMADFREVNGGPTQGAPPSAANRADAMADFREVNGGPTQGAPPSAANRADAMADFREVNGLAGAPSAALVGAPPSAANRDAAMADFREVNGGPTQGAPPSAANRDAAMQDFREVNATQGAPPSAANREGAMEDFREVNGPAPKQSAWVMGARAYNAKHDAFVTEFNNLTGGSCTGDDAILDPNKVARWQADHGLAPDGRVGPHTLAKARQADAAAAATPTPAAAPVADAAVDPMPPEVTATPHAPAVDPTLLADLE